MKYSALALVLCAAACSEASPPAAVSAAEAASPAETDGPALADVATDRAAISDIGTRIADDLIGREDFMMYRVDDVEALHYAEAAAAYGAAKFAGLTGQDDIVAALAARHRRVLDEDVPNTANHVDANVYAVWPLELYMQTGDRAAYEFGMALADGQWESPRPDDGLSIQTRFWIDDVWMIGALQTQAYRASGEAVYIDRAARTAAAYIGGLQQPNGLFHHGPEAPFFWGRGNGWVAAGLAEIISELPQDSPYYDEVVGGYLKMMEALLAYQADDGMWRQLIDYPEAWKETSATAMFGYAMAAGVNRGLLDEETYGTAAAKAWTALAGYVGADGLVSDVCVGTGQSQDAAYYLNRPTVTGDFHGQAPMLWFASELLQYSAD